MDFLPRGQAMFVRECWKPGSEGEIFDLVEKNPWGLLVSNGPADGLLAGPFATNLPFVLDRGRRKLNSHLSRDNAHARVLRTGTAPVLAIFEGPCSYVTASWYPERSMPSTVYYTAVHCYGTLTFQDNAELRASLEELTTLHERRFPDGWKTSDIPESEITRRLPYIQGFELKIERLEAKFKLGQDEPKRDAMTIAEKLLASDSPQDRLLGEMTRRYNENRP
jgi:transcriptional regulator